MRVALVQLPLQSHDYAYSQENIPLAAGYLASYAAANSVPAEIVICPPETANLGGDAAILRWLEDLRPDVVGFSCYLWNIHRTLYLCGLIRQRLEGSLVVLGGPEVTPDNEFLLGRDCFDLGVVGEGEETFEALLRAAGDGMHRFLRMPGLLVRSDAGTVYTGPRGLLGCLDDIPSPYLSGILAPGLNRGLVMETVRGCPMRCAYCYYHKSSPNVRTFSAGRIARELGWAARKGINEVTLIDPCFARRPGLMGLLKDMAAARPQGGSFSCELIAEDMTAPLVDALAEAGLSNVEIGLQSTNQKALRMVKRRFQKEAFIRGVRLLRRAGIRVMTDVMVGLPGDRLEDVKRSIDFVLEEGLCDDLSLYPLSVLPGTVLRAHSAGFGISYQHEPPYLAVSTADMDRHDIREAFSYAEEVVGRDYFPVEPPLTGEGEAWRSGRLVHSIVINGKGKGFTISPADLGQALCIEVRARALFNQGFLKDNLQPLLAQNPFTLVSWVIPEDAYDPRETPRLITSIGSTHVHPADREYMAAFSPTRSTQLFLKGSTASGGVIYTQIPLDADPARPLWAGLPGDAPAEEELSHTGRMEALLGYRPDIRYHDLVENSHAIGRPTQVEI